MNTISRVCTRTSAILQTQFCSYTLPALHWKFCKPKVFPVPVGLSTKAAVDFSMAAAAAATTRSCEDKGSTGKWISKPLTMVLKQSLSTCTTSWFTRLTGWQLEAPRAGDITPCVQSCRCMALTPHNGFLLYTFEGSTSESGMAQRCLTPKKDALAHLQNQTVTSSTRVILVQLTWPNPTYPTC